MSWAYGFVDGRYVGYGVFATCDKQGCDAVIDRGLDSVCGDFPHRPFDDEPGCGRFFCDDHRGWLGDRGGCQHRQRGAYGRTFCQRLADSNGVESCACGIDHPLRHLAALGDEP